MSPRSYILLGPPGSGKSTQALLLSRAFSLVHIDIGKELRKAAQEKTSLGREIDEAIHHRKEFVSDEVVEEVLKKALENLLSTQGILLDGAPRRMNQIAGVLRILDSSLHKVKKVLSIRLSEEESVRRISKRFQCTECAHPLILGKDVLSPGDPCPICGGKIGQRGDDTPEGVHKRYAIFERETQPVLEYFHRRGMLFEVDGEEDIEKSGEKIMAMMKKEGV